MSQIIDPVILDETGKIIGNKIDERTQTFPPLIDAVTNAIPMIRDAMDRLDIIYYVEND